MPISITVIFANVREALEYFKEVMTGKGWEADVEVHINGDIDDMAEFHEAMTQVVTEDMISKVEQHLSDISNGSDNGKS